MLASVSRPDQHVREGKAPNSPAPRLASHRLVVTETNSRNTSKQIYVLQYEHEAPVTEIRKEERVSIYVQVCGGGGGVWCVWRW
ncbi:hypothetical protein E2C01_098550 [Portunus trituberculatus]|uniref:Uncharacterized protein n=1 Tax=Portunus trituberculatus TaxID=210409 RepID=A0A5B7K1H9_PORTR|nr:hypothetical protein [Portunus trituberculatus]